MTSNSGIISGMGTSVVQLKDGVDNIHSGIIKALQAATGDNRGIDGFDLTQTTNGGTTRFVVGAGKVLRNGKLVSVSGTNLDTTSSTIGSGSSDWYGLIVVCDGTESGETANTLKWRPGDITGYTLRNSSATVAELKGGDIPIIVVQIAAASANSANPRKHQYLPYEQSIREFSAINSGTERLRINKEGTLTHTPSSTAYSLTLPSASGTIALTSDLSNLAAGSLAGGAVTEPKLATSAVTTTKIANDAVTFAKMQDLSAAYKLIGTGGSSGEVSEVSVASGHLSDNAVTTAKIATGAVTSAKIANATIVAEDLASGAVTLDKIADIAQDRILARVASGTGDVQAITAAQLRTLINVEDNADVTNTARVKSALGGDLGSDFTIGDSSDTTTVAGNLTVSGNLIISGTSTTVNTATLDVADNNITLNSDYSGNSPSQSAGITVNRGGGSAANKTFLWDESTDKWTVGSETLVAGTFEGNLTGNVSTATALANARNFSISGDVTASAVSFDGTGNVALATSLAAGVVDTAELASGAVETSKIENLNVTRGKIANDAIDSTKLENNAVTTTKIADDAVRTAHIADDQITSALIADDAIITALIADNAVTNDHLAGSIAQSKITGLTSALAGKQASLTFGTGLSNSGATINVDIDELSTENGMDKDNDFIMYDDADSGLKKINLTNIFSKISESNLPSLSAAKITSGTFSAARIPSLATSKITSGTFATARIADDAVTFAKVQNIGSGTLLGRTSSGTGEIETLSASAVRTFLNVDTAGTDNSTNVTLTGSRDYLTISGQAITVGQIDISDDTNLVAGDRISLSGDTLNVDADLSNYDNSTSGFLTAHPTISGAASSSNNENRTYIQDITLDSNGHVIGIGTATETVTDTQYSVGDGGLTQNNFTNALKSKLDAIETNANNFILQTASASTLGGVKIGSNLTINAGTGVLSADTQSDVNFTSALNTKLAGIETGATAGANFATNVSNISVTNAQLAGSIANSKLANSSVTINGSTVALGGSITLTTANVAEGANLYFTEERVDDRVNALITDGEGITTTYNDSSGTLTIDAEDATASNKGVASFASADFDISSGAVSVKSGGISNTQLAGSISNDKLLAIPQSKVTGLVSALAGKAGSLSDLSITASAAEINILDGVTGVSAAEISHLDGVTSSIQTQLNAKQAAGNYLTTSATIADLAGITALDTDITAVSDSHDTVPSAKAVKSYVDLVSFDANDTQYTFSVEDGSTNTKRLKLTGTDGSFTSVNFEGSNNISVSRINERIIMDLSQPLINGVSFSGNTLSLVKTDNNTLTTTIPDATTSTHGLMTDDQFDKLAGIEASADVTDKANVVAALALLDETDTLHIGDAGNDTTVRVRGNLFVDGTTTTVNQTKVDVQNAFVFEGASADAHETTLTIVDPTADRTINLPNISGTLITTGDTGTVSSGMIATDAITNVKLANNAVDTAEIADSAVTAIKMATGSVVTSRLADGAVTTAKIALGGVNTARLADDTVTPAKISVLDDNVVGLQTHILIGDGGDFHNYALSGDITMTSTGVTSIGSGKVTTSMLASNAVAFDKLPTLTGPAFIARSESGTGNVGSVSAAIARNMLNVENGADVTDATNVAAAGAVMDSDFTSNGLLKRTGAGTYTVVAVDASGHPDISAANSSNNSGRTYIQDITVDANGHVTHINTATETEVKRTQEEIEDFVGGMVTGNTETFITVTYQDGDGTLDFVVPVLDEDNLNSNSDTHLATQQSIKTYVDNQVLSLIDSAPATLNTLNELAAAINDDTNFSNTVTTALGNRLRVDTASQGLSGTQQSNARTNLNVDVAGTDNSTDVTLASVSNNYLSISGQAITAGTVPISLGGTGATSASAARSALGVDAAGTDNSTNVTLTGSGNYLSISGQAITVDPIDISDDTNLTAGTGLTLSGDTLNVNAAQSGITSVGTLSSLTVSGDVTVDTNTFKIDSTNNRVGIGTASPGYKLQVEGSFAAQTKSFVIPHPTQEGKTLQHGSLEGPEHGVYHRGRLEGNVIQLPEYWTELVDEDTISVQLTANGDFQMLYVEKIEDNQVFVANAADEGIDCFYLIHGERKDVGKMEVEY
jgi:hypothetical protein